MSNEQPPINEFSESERAALSRELMDPATSFERISEISELVQARTAPSEGASVAGPEPTTTFDAMSDEELAARLADPSVSGPERDEIATYVNTYRTNKPHTPPEDTPGTPE